MFRLFFSVPVHCLLFVSNGVSCVNYTTLRILLSTRYSPCLRASKDRLDRGSRMIRSCGRDFKMALFLSQLIPRCARAKTHTTTTTTTALLLSSPPHEIHFSHCTAPLSWQCMYAEGGRNKIGAQQLFLFLYTRGAAPLYTTTTVYMHWALIHFPLWCICKLHNLYISKVFHGMVRRRIEEGLVRHKDCAVSLSSLVPFFFYWHCIMPDPRFGLTDDLMT